MQTIVDDAAAPTDSGDGEMSDDDVTPKEKAGAFGMALRKARLDCGLSIRECAWMLGVTHVRYGEVERGKRLPDYTNAERRWFAFASGTCNACGRPITTEEGTER